MRQGTCGKGRAIGIVWVALLAGIFIGSPRAYAGSEGDGAARKTSHRAYGGARDYARTGFFIGMGANYAWENFDIADEERRESTPLDSTNTWGFNARLGYRFHPNLAVETEVDYLQEFDLETPEGEARLRLDGFAVTANGKLFFLTGRFQPYALLGAGVLSTNLEGDAFTHGRHQRRTEFVGRGGLGLDFYLLRDVVLDVEASYLLPAGALRDYQMLSVSFGAQYRF